jgi:RHS repeat-associated protein
VNLISGGIYGFFSRTDSGGTSVPLVDGMGSTIALTDSSGTPQAQYTYEPFGNTTVTGPGHANSFQYTGRENDGTGLYFYWARYYSPSIQRFVSEDPSRFQGGFNLYAYNILEIARLTSENPSGRFFAPWHYFITYEAARQAG